MAAPASASRSAARSRACSAASCGSKARPARARPSRWSFRSTVRAARCSSQVEHWLPLREPTLQPRRASEPLPEFADDRDQHRARRPRRADRRGRSDLRRTAARPCPLGRPEGRAVDRRLRHAGAGAQAHARTPSRSISAFPTSTAGCCSTCCATIRRPRAFRSTSSRAPTISTRWRGKGATSVSTKPVSPDELTPGLRGDPASGECARSATCWSPIPIRTGGCRWSTRSATASPSVTAIARLAANADEAELAPLRCHRARLRPLGQGECADRSPRSRAQLGDAISKLLIFAPNVDALEQALALNPALADVPRAENFAQLAPADVGACCRATSRRRRRAERPKVPTTPTSPAPRC